MANLDNLIYPPSVLLRLVILWDQHIPLYKNKNKKIFFKNGTYIHLKNL